MISEYVVGFFALIGAGCCILGLVLVVLSLCGFEFNIGYSNMDDDDETKSI